MGWEWIYLKLPSTVILTMQKPLIFLSLIFFAIKLFFMLLCQNDLETKTTLNDKSYVSKLRWINMFVNKGVKVL